MTLKIAKFPRATDDEIGRQVHLLEDVLAEAKSGNFATLMMIGLTHEGDVLKRWTACDNLILLCGHVSHLLHTIHRRLDGVFD